MSRKTAKRARFYLEMKHARAWITYERLQRARQWREDFARFLSSGN